MAPARSFKNAKNYNAQQQNSYVRQENARLNVRRALHPFFSKQKVSSLKTTLVFDETTTCQVEFLQPCPPIHVTQYNESTRDGRTEIERMLEIDSSCLHESGEEKVYNLEQKRCTLMQHFLPSRPVDDTVQRSLNAFSAASGHVNLEEASPGGTSFHEALKDLLKYMQIEQTSKSRTEGAGEQSQGPGVGDRNTFEELQTKLELYNSCHETLRSADNFTKLKIVRDRDVLCLTQNFMWTDLYQPKSSKEVCGNGTEVEFLRNWLHMWQQKMLGQVKSGENVRDGLKRDNEVKSDVDTDSDEDLGLDNTLLITGPEGCGKSAAVYACAHEADLAVIEVDKCIKLSSGILIKHKFGEAMQSHGIRESPQQLSKMGVKEQDSKVGQLKQLPLKQKKESLKRKFVGSSPLKSCQEAPISGQNDHQMDSDIKGRTVILFEDVDKHFEEDKGFLTALVQLSRITKRPIILTSNKRDPRLPKELEKCRIDLNYPTAQELVFHACMVCIAEGVSCNPWIVERMVYSCQFDLRKVIMALQFWGQGKAPLFQQSLLSMSGCASNPSDDLEQGNKLNIQGTIGLESVKCSSLGSPDRSFKISLDDMKCERPLHMKGSFEWWESDARRLFELDVHHLVLPKVVSCSFACPLSLFVADKISAAASKRETYLLEVAAAIVEEQAFVKKSLRKAKECTKVLRHKCKGLDARGDTICVNAPNECKEMKHSCVKSLVGSPVKSLRAVKSLARSPLLPKRLTLQQHLVLCDSDGDNGQGLQILSGKYFEQDEKRTSDAEAMGSCAQTSISNVEDNSPVDVFCERLEGVEAISSTNEPVMTVKRRRVTRKISNQTKIKSLPSGLSEAFHGEAPSICVETLGVQEHVFGGSLRFENNLVSPNMNARVTNEASTSADVLVCAEINRKHFRVQTNLDALSGKVPIDWFDPVKDTWTSLCESQDKLRALVEHGHTSAHVTSSVADLLDVISASDVISGVQTEAYQDAQWSLDGAAFQSWEGNIGHCNDWDVCQEMASQLVCVGLQHSIACLPVVEHSGNESSILSCVLEGAKDTPAVGGFMVNNFQDRQFMSI